MRISIKHARYKRLFFVSTLRPVPLHSSIIVLNKTGIKLSTVYAKTYFQKYLSQKIVTTRLSKISFTKNCNNQNRVLCTMHLRCTRSKYININYGISYRFIEKRGKGHSYTLKNNRNILNTHSHKKKYKESIKRKNFGS